MDWGILDSLRLLNQGSLKLRVGTEPIARSEWTAEDREYLWTYFQKLKAFYSQAAQQNNGVLSYLD